MVCRRVYINCRHYSCNTFTPYTAHKHLYLTLLTLYTGYTLITSAIYRHLEPNISHSHVLVARYNIILQTYTLIPTSNPGASVNGMFCNTLFRYSLECTLKIKYFVSSRILLNMQCRTSIVTYTKFLTPNQI